MSVYDYRRTPIEQKAAEATFRIVSYENFSALGILCPQFKATKQGHLIDSDFKKYVEGQVKGTKYIEIRYKYRELIGYKYIAWAYVYYWKNKK